MLSIEFSRKLSPIAAKKAVVVTTIIILAIAGISLVLSSAVGLGAYYIKSGRDAVVAPIEEQLNTLKQGIVDRAYQKYTSQAFKNKTTLADYTDLVKSNPQIFKSQNADFDSIDVRNNQAKVSTIITGQDGTVTPLTFNLVFEKNRWLILGFKQGN